MAAFPNKMALEAETSRPETAATAFSTQAESTRSAGFEMGAGLLTNGPTITKTAVQPTDFYGRDSANANAANADLEAVEDEAAEIVGKKKKRRKNRKKKKKDGTEESNASITR
jgi:hypothetical protein